MSESAKGPAPSGAPVRGTFISSIAEAAVDVRKACNVIKRTSHLGAASMRSNVSPIKAVALSHGMSMQVLESIGFNTSDERRVQSVMPLMMEATSCFLHEAIIAFPKPFAITDEDLKLIADRGVRLLAGVAKSRTLAKMIEPMWPVDIDSVTALRLAASAAMGQVAVEVVYFDFGHPAADCIKETSKVVVNAALRATKDIAPASASAAAKLMLAQSLVGSSAKLFAACWKSESDYQVAELDRLSAQEANNRLDAMGKVPLASLIGDLVKRFNGAFAAVVATTNEMLAEEAIQNLVTSPRPASTAVHTQRPIPAAKPAAAPVVPEKAPAPEPAHEAPAATSSPAGRTPSRFPMRKVL